MKKITLFIGLAFLCINLFSQQVDLEDHPPIWNSGVLSNSIGYTFPFKDESSSFNEAAIYFEKKENSSFISLRYRVFPNYSLEDLGVKSTPTMLVKLGDGTILTGQKERIVSGVLNGRFVVDVYFNLSNELQQKIINSGIEKVRIAFNYSFMGINENRIYDAYPKDSTIDGVTIADYLAQVKNASINKAKEQAKKNNLEYNF